MKEINQLLNEAKKDGITRYTADWQGRAVAALNNYYLDKELYEETIYDLSSDEWDDIVKQQLEQRGWVGIKYFLADINNTADYAIVDAYGNGSELTGSDLVGALEDIIGGMYA